MDLVVGIEKNMMHGSFVKGDSDGIVVWLQFVGFFSLVGVRSRR